MTRVVNWPARLALTVALLAAVVLLLTGPGYRLDWLALGLIFFTLFPWITYAAGAAVLLGLAGLFMAWRGRRGAVTSLVAIVIAAATLAVPLSMRYQGRQVPPIHDISTDLINPPAFDVVVALRGENANPPEHEGNEVAIAQRAAYPDLQTIRLRNPADEVFSAARQAVIDLGWELHVADAQSGRIEATDTTAWFGFKDDVVIRIVAAPAVTAVDVRSKSRVGRSDLGKNAARIRAFRKELLSRLL